MNWINQSIKKTCYSSLEKAQEQQNQLTKPAGSLGYLENIVMRLASMQACQKPSLDKAHISIFAADHGIANEGVSAFPQTVTNTMVANFASGGAAISVLAKAHNATLEIINVGVVDCVSDGILHQPIADGTANFSQQAAMTVNQLEQALEIGRQAIDRLTNTDVFIGGEMGIANTTSASALACAILKSPIEQLVGAGTGANQQGIIKKQRLIEQALELHKEHLNSPLKILQYLGGFEIAALVGAYIRCGQLGIPVIIDGFISTVAALIAVRIHSSLNDWFFYGHQSEELGHKNVLKALDARPILNLAMRLGEGSGAAMALPILRASCELHNNMASFNEAGISV